MKAAEKHLTTEQIEHLGQTGLLPSEPTVDQEARRHWASCEACQRLVRMHEDFGQRLRALRDMKTTAASPACPVENELWKLVCGMLRPPRAEELLEHAIGCGHCGPVLRSASEILDEETTETELAQVSALASATTVWQNNLARQLARSQTIAEGQGSHARPFRFFYRRSRRSHSWPYFAAAATILIALVATATWFGLRQTSIQQLLAQAYTEQRTSELRLSGALYAPLRVERGRGASRLSRPSALLEAEARIAKEYSKRPEDGLVLAAKGRAELLESNFDEAVQNLQTALALVPNANSVRIDLASAYSERAQAKNQPWDDGQAVELLQTVLRQNPRESVALFNLAIILERQSLYNEAAQRWQLYLAIDPDSGWASEARSHLSNDETKIQKMSSAEPLDNPNQFEVSEGSGDSQAEEYLREATLVWLPTAFRHTTADNSQVSLTALKRLSMLLATRHGDNWMADLLRDTESQEIASGLADLATAVKANETGDYATAVIQAHAATLKFASNRPAYLRARFEEAYSARLSHNAKLCNGEITPVLQELAQKQYRWLLAQATMEQQECLNMLGEIGAAAALSAVTMATAERGRYPGLAARALLFAADIDEAAGNVPSAWRRTHAGLARSWTDGLPAMRIYGFETELETLAGRAGQPQFDAIVIRESLKIMERDSNPLMLAAEHHRLAETALLTEDYSTAEEHFTAARVLYSSAPSSPVTDANRIETEIWLARVEVQRGQFADARRRLQSTRDTLATVSNRYLLTDYFQTLGKAELGLGTLADSDASLETALSLTERERRSLRSEAERLNWQRESSSVYRDLVSLRLKQGNPVEALEVWEWYRSSSPPNLRRAKSTSPKHLRSSGIENISKKITVSDIGTKIQTTLPLLKHETILSFAFLRGGVEVWAYDDRGIFHQSIEDPSGTLPESIRRFTALCADPTSNPSTLHALGRRLYDAFLAPVRAHLLPERTLIVEPDGPLWSLSFAAIIDSQGKYLADTFTLSELPTTFFDGVYRSPSPNGTEGALVIAAPNSVSFGGDLLPALPSALSEAHKVAELLPGAVSPSSRSLTASYLRAELPKMRIFHFAGHAVLTSEESFLVLSPDPDGASAATALSSVDIAALPLHSLRLAVLSGCATATGPAANGLIDAHNLARAFLDAGTAEVLATRWNIDSSTAELFMTAFYTAFVTGRTAPQSLKDAALHLRSMPGHAHPYYWAAFDTFGWA